MGWLGWAVCRRAEARRRQALRAAPDGALREYLGAPLPGPGVPHTRLPLLAVDLETTGLDPAVDRIVSVGMVPLEGTRVVLSGARRIVVRVPQVGRSAVYHRITDDEVRGGVPLATAVDEVLRALRGRVLLAHHAALERAFLDAACRAVHGAPMPSLHVDTLALAQRLTASAWDDEPAPGSLRLDAARARHGLPRYRSHEALTDALAGAELYLAQVADLGGGRPVPLHRLLVRPR